jgi:hypothetical protein
MLRTPITDSDVKHPATGTVIPSSQIAHTKLVINHKIKNTIPFTTTISELLIFTQQHSFHHQQLDFAL